MGGGIRARSEQGTAIGVGRVHITLRQAEILHLAAEDLGDKQIAERLHISISTVRTQLKRFYKANGVHSRTGAVGLWLRSRPPRFEQSKKLTLVLAILLSLVPEERSFQTRALWFDSAHHAR